MGDKRGRKAGGGRLPNSGPKKVPSIKRAYMVPLMFKDEASAEIKAILKKYRIQYHNRKG